MDTQGVPPVVPNPSQNTPDYEGGPQPASISGVQYTGVPVSPAGQQASGQPPKKSSGSLLKIILILLVIGIVIFGVVVVVLPMITGPKEIKITWWGLREEESVVAPLISEYEAAHPNVKIEYVNQNPTDYRERLVNALVSGKGPDIFHFHNTWVPQLGGQLDAVPDAVIDSTTFANTYYPVALNDLVKGSQIMGLPLEYDGLALYVNTELFNSVGRPFPSTWDELRETATALTIRDSRGVITQSGVALGNTKNVDHWPEILALMMIQNRANPANPTDKLAAKALEYFTLFSRVDKVWDETLPSSTEAFSSGKLAMYFAPSWRYFEIKQKNPDLKFITIPVPQVPKDLSSEPDITYATYWVEGVSGTSSNKKDAWDFLKFMSTNVSLTKLFESAAKVRDFGQPYPKVEMAGLLADNPIMESFVKYAPNAASWYLASDTYDGQTGINSIINKYYADAVDAVVAGGDAVTVLKTTALGVAQALSQYQK